MNSWLEGGTHARRSTSTARFHPEEGARQGLEDGGEVLLEAGVGRSLRCLVEFDPTLRPGVVVIPYGSVEGSPNRLIGTDELEEFTGQPRSNGLRVRASAPQ